MSESTHLTPADIDGGRRLQEAVRSLCPSALCILAGRPPQDHELRRATVVVAGAHGDCLERIFNHDGLPHSTPVLILGQGGDLPAALLDRKDGRLIDYLALPAPLAILGHRLAFLSRVQRISSEHQASFATLDRQLNALTTRDGLTGLFNRRHLTTNLKRHMDEARDSGHDLCLLLFNIDFFNAVNKAAGQQYGDFILNEMAARLKKATRPEDGCYRFSGEDFVVLMPETGLDEARRIGENIRRLCFGKPYSSGDVSHSITVSMGLASLREHLPTSHDEFINMAETALFLAKARGRNRLQTYMPRSGVERYDPRQSMGFLKDSLNRILEKTKTSAIASVQLLARHLTGPEHEEHAETVSRYITLLGERLRMPRNHLETFHNAIALCSSFRSLLHNDLISRPQHLSMDERKILEDLPFKLVELTDMFDYFAKEREVLLCHGERFDGSGYPQGLKGDDIPLGARIFTLIDALAAMTADRPYRPRLAPEQIVDELLRQAGRQFDPALVFKVFELIEENRLLDLDGQVLERARATLLSAFPHLRP